MNNPVPEVQIAVEAPPEPPAAAGGGGWLVAALPMLGSLGSVAYLAASQPGRTWVVAAAGVALTSVGFVAATVWRQRAQSQAAVDSTRARYLGHLGDVRLRAEAAMAARRAALVLAQPHPVSGIVSPAVGERVLDGQDGACGSPVLALRLGTCRGASGVALTVGVAAPLSRPDPVLVTAVRRLEQAVAEADDLPFVLDVPVGSTIDLLGAPQQARAVARALIAAAARAGWSVDVRPGAETPVGEWDWTSWLPDPWRSGAAPRLVVADQCDPAPDPGVLLVRVAPEAPLAGGLAVALAPDGDTAEVSWAGRTWRPVRPDALSPAAAEVVARSRVRGGGVRPGDPTSVPPALWRPEEAWRARVRGQRLRAYLGTDLAGEPLVIDLKQPAEGGVGPHGILVGATGSGKSEVLRALVLSLIATHGPDVLNLVLVDFKGGATFAGLAAVPHVAGVITNLGDDLQLVDRMAAALLAEVVRREELLRDAGAVASVGELEGRGGDLLPDLLVVIDEFAELLVARPEVVDVLGQLGRVGRSLGIHLLLASQRLDEGRLRGLDAHLSYRIGLRVQSPGESRALLGIPDAAALPTRPGEGYLRTGPQPPTRFRAAYVSGPVPDLEDNGADIVLPVRRRSGPASLLTASTPTRTAAPSVLEALAQRMVGHGPVAHRVWLPPLDRSPELADLLATAPADPLVVPVGLVDRPDVQRYHPLLLDLRGAGGHIAIVGGPRSGRSSALATVVAALATRTTSAQTQFYVIGSGGPALADLAALPHVGVVTRAGDVERAASAIDHVGHVVQRRRAEPTGRAGHWPDGRGHVFLVIDGWAALRAVLPDAETAVSELATTGLGYGVHVLLSASRWLDLRGSLRDALGTRLELRLGEPADSEIDRRAARAVPIDRPGRGLAPSGHQMIWARSTGVAWPTGGPRAPGLPILPPTIRTHQLPVDGADRVVLGVDETGGPWSVPCAAHLLVVGDPGSGKTTLLRTYAAQLCRTVPASGVQVVLLDPRGSLEGCLDPAYLLGRWTGTADLRGEAAALADYLDSRRRAGTRARAAVHLVIDDEDLLDGPGGEQHPLAGLLEMVSRDPAGQVRLVVARRARGIGRAVGRPPLSTILQADALPVLLSGPPDEHLRGRRMRHLPPGRGVAPGPDGHLVQVQSALPADPPFPCDETHC